MKWQEALEHKQQSHIILHERGEAALQGPTAYGDTYRLVSSAYQFRAEHIPSAQAVQRILEEFAIPQDGWR